MRTVRSRVRGQRAGGPLGACRECRIRRVPFDYSVKRSTGVGMRSILSGWAVRLWSHKAAPYIMLELLLPGGSLLALLLFLCRRYKLSIGNLVPKIFSRPVELCQPHSTR